MFIPDLIGHFHPLIVHLPIGILFFAALLTLVGRIKNWEIEQTVSLAWATGALTAIFACITGWILSQSGAFDSDLLEKHQWTGIATAILAIATYFLKQYRSVLAIATIIILSIAGHFGGSLTHGENYFFPNDEVALETALQEEFEQAIDSSATDSIQITAPTHKKTFLYKDNVEPILRTKCYSCHGPNKKKGGLRLDSESHIHAGGKNGSVLTKGQPNKSTLYTYLLLPEGDKKHMPPKGKLQLTKNDISKIHMWISKGASFVEEIEVIEGNQTLQEVVVEQSQISDISEVELENQLPTPKTKSLESLILAQKIPKVDSGIFEKLKENQVVLKEIGDGSNYWSANFVNVKQITNTTFKDLQAIKDHLVRLKISNQEFGNEQLKQLNGFDNLTRLNIENTKITDEGLDELLNLPRLEQLNLYGTEISDAGLTKLAKYPSLKVVYLWQTKTTTAGLAQLQKLRPDLKIETGTLQLTKPDTNKTK